MDLGLRIDEEFARWSFEQYLESKGVSKQEWSKGGERRLPPDCYLTVDDKVFVVEITTLIEKVNTSRKVVSRITIDETVEDFVEEIEKEQLDEGLSGLYYLRFPPVDVDFYSHRHRLKNSILTYIRSTQFQGQFDPENIVGIPYCSIQKSDKSMNGIVIAAYPPDSRWAIDIPSEACDLLQEVISKKKDRIRGLDKPKILIIINRYAFEGIIGNTTYFHDCMPVLSDLEAFHTVYMVAQEKENTDGVIHTLHPNWG